MNGAFQTSRAIFENPIWQNVVEFRLFFLIYGKAVFREEGVTIGDLKLERGQWVRSYRNLQSDLEYIENRAIKRYSLSRIKRAVEGLIKDGRIIAETCELGTLFTVINYNKYQGFENYRTPNENAERTQRERRENAERTQRERRENNNNNDNNDKKVNNDKKKVPVPYQQIVELYHNHCPSLPRVIDLTDSRKKTIRARWQKLKTLDEFKKFFCRVEVSDFLTGRTGKFTSCGFDWIMKQANFVKIQEGNYDNKGGCQSGQGVGKNTAATGGVQGTARSAYEKDYRSGHEEFFE